MPYTIYFTDTSSELKDLRPVLFEQIRQAGMQPVELEDSARSHPETIADEVRKHIQAADAVIGVVTYRRGWLPAGHGGKSLAEIEYFLALELGKPCAVLLPDPKSDMAMYLRRRAFGQPEDEKQAQQSFWKRISGSNTVAYFHDEADLSAKVVQILNEWAAAMRPQAATTQETGAVPAEARGEAADGLILERSPQKFQAVPSAPPALDIESLAETVANRTAVKLYDLQQRQQKELAEQAVKYNEALRLHPGELVFGRPSATSQFQSDIFMVMPFAPEFGGIYTNIIRPLAASLGLTITRGDEFQSSRGSIIEEVWTALNACRFVIAEITGGNDNVFYELGIAHTLNKPAILITQAAQPEQVPFDIRHLRYIHYDNTAEGGMKLSEDLRTAITRLQSDLAEGWGT